MKALNIQSLSSLKIKRWFCNDCERTFSNYNNFHIDSQPNLKLQKIENVLNVRIDGPKLIFFYPTVSIETWKEQRKRNFILLVNYNFISHLLNWNIDYLLCWQWPSRYQNNKKNTFLVFLRKLLYSLSLFATSYRTM